MALNTSNNGGPDAEGGKASADKAAPASADKAPAPGRQTRTQYLAAPPGGRPLPESITRTLGPKLGPLDDVRVYDDAQAAAMVRTMGAQAFTHGRNIFLAPGANEDTLAHEAAHAAQHHGPPPTGPADVAADGGHEDFADRAAAARYAPGMDLAAPKAAPGIRKRETNVSDGDVVAILAKEINKDKTKAATMLRNASDGQARGKIEAAVKQAFPDKDDAKNLIEQNPAGGGAVPVVKGADEAASQGKGKGGDGKLDAAGAEIGRASCRERVLRLV